MRNQLNVLLVMLALVLSGACASTNHQPMTGADMEPVPNASTVVKEPLETDDTATDLEEVEAEAVKASEAALPTTAELEQLQNKLEETEAKLAEELELTRAELEAARAASVEAAKRADEEGATAATPEPEVVEVRRKPTEEDQKEAERALMLAGEDREGASDQQAVDVTVKTVTDTRVFDPELTSEKTAVGEPVIIESDDDIDTLPEEARESASTLLDEQSVNNTFPNETIPHRAGADAWRSTQEAPKTTGDLVAEFSEDSELCNDWIELHPEFDSCTVLIDRADGFIRQPLPRDFRSTVSGKTHREEMVLAKGDEVWLERRVDPDGRTFFKVLGRVACTNAVHGLEGEIYLSHEGKIIVLPVYITREFTITKTVEREVVRTVVTKERRKTRFSLFGGPVALERKTEDVDVTEGVFAVSYAWNENGGATGEGDWRVNFTIRPPGGMTVERKEIIWQGQSFSQLSLLTHVDTPGTYTVQAFLSGTRNGIPVSYMWNETFTIPDGFTGENRDIHTNLPRGFEEPHDGMKWGLQLGVRVDHSFGKSERFGVFGLVGANFDIEESEVHSGFAAVGTHIKLSEVIFTDIGVEYDTEHDVGGRVGLGANISERWAASVNASINEGGEAYALNVHYRFK